MSQNPNGYTVEGPDFKDAETEVLDLNETLQKVDKILAEFYEIHGTHIKDQGHNP